ncbi:hypothetical protein [Clostridium beijerinckii]|nr:hypothetical protein [Clostridium beijerinckii]
MKRREDIMKRKIISFCSVLVCCIIAFLIFYHNTQYNKYTIKGSAYITEKNKHLVGTEVLEGKGQVEEYDEHNMLKYSKTIKNIPDEMKLADSALISDFVTKEKNNEYITPEIIETNGSIGVFTKDDGSGWKLNKGDSLVFNFDKYQSKATKNQTAVIGHVVNGKMVKGEKFKDLSGSYEITADEPGEYYIYTIDASSEYLAFKQGSISVHEC